MNVTADVKGRLSSTPSCQANPQDHSPIQKQSSSGLSGPKAHQQVTRYAIGLPRLSKNKRHPRQNSTWRSCSVKASGRNVMTMIQLPIRKWSPNFERAIKPIRNPLSLRRTWPLRCLSGSPFASQSALLTPKDHRYSSDPPENPVLGGVFLCQGSGIAGPVAVGSSGISGISSST